MTKPTRATSAIKHYNFDGSGPDSVFNACRFKVDHSVFSDYDTATVYALLRKYRDVNAADHSLRIICDAIGIDSDKQ